MTNDNDAGERPKRPFAKRPFDKDKRSGDRPFSDKRKPFSGDRRPEKAETRGRSTAAEAPEEGERIAKRLARAGIASRREAETMIAAGRISVNGKLLESPAVNVLRSDRIEVDGKPLRPIERTRLWLYHKPAGLVTTNRDPEGRPTVFESLPEDLPRVLSVGRLDINTEGLLLLTNDGGLARILELPSTGWLRRYRVRAHGKVTQAQLDELKNGIAVDGVFYGSIEAQLEREQGSNVWINIGLREGKNREVKNIMGALGLTVGRLIRVSFGPFQLGDLEEGAVREIRGRTLRDQLGEKLIEESGADFDAPIINEFSNAPVAGARVAVERERPARRSPEWISASGDTGKGKGPRRGKDDSGSRRSKDEWREDTLSRWSTSPAPRSRGPAKGRDDRKEMPERKARGVNVWMAPGARPQGKKSAAEETTEKPRRASSPHGEARSETRRSGAFDTQEAKGRWSKPDGEARPPRRERPEGEGRPPRRERPEGERPQRAGKRERAEAREGQERSFGEGKRSFTPRDGEKRSFDGKPRTPRPSGDRPSGGKPGGTGKPRGPKGGGNADRRR
ncbi:pseudouridine synthase [Brucella endophytica]|uniref:Pseudouridine synthase n=1 Tax=Brucella endophytica TaxID=1963359 RepID=A0A916S012_9HYPH|nr:pseudouridine synthase [Brucella endophytica]GGA78279.1 pseudouridine synthase [Brucella endophytica]